MPQDLKGDNIVITGAGRGLGAALALSLADLGCNPILCARGLEALDAVGEQIATRTGMVPLKVRLDLADPASIASAVRQIADNVSVVDILINNGAMYLGQRDTPYSDSEVTAAVASAITGTFLLTQALLPALMNSSRPDIVTIGSVSGLPNVGLHNVGVPFYAAKHGQTALADGLRERLRGTPVRSICIHPPWIEDISPLEPAWESVPDRRKGERATNRDIVQAVIFAITRPRHITIASMIVDSDSKGMNYTSHL